MRFWAGSIICALIAGCQTAPPAPPETAASPDRIAFEMKSWGAPVHSWSVAADGSATSVTRTGSLFPPYVLEHRRFVLPAAELARLQKLAGEVPNPPPSDDGCKNRITDAPYGSLTLWKGPMVQTLPFYAGCFDQPYARYVAHLKAMDDLVLDIGENTSVERREEVTSPH